MDTPASLLEQLRNPAKQEAWVRFGEARPEFECAASLTRNARERELLLERARACAGGSTPPEPR